MNALLLVFGVCLLIFFILSTIKLLYYRYLRTYKQEIKTYLEPKGYNYVETIGPKKEDWARSPFEKPSIFIIGFYMQGIRWTNYEYLIAIGQRGQKYQQFWFELKTSYFQKPSIVFRDGRKINYTQVSNSESFQENCPECGFLLFNKTDKNCPGCGHQLIQTRRAD
jgi:hypothetical protein